MGKSPGFWFFTGDWMKDSELRFCSIFARGLLVDLLCILFEAKERGYASNPDGTPRTDEQIVDAITGGSREEKLAALAELEKSGVLSRDFRGVLYSRRLARLAEVSETRSKCGSKGGSKTQANLKQTQQQTNKQNRGVSDSDSDSVTSNKKSKKERTDVHSSFADWWSVYPRREGKAVAGQAYGKALATIAKADGCTIDEAAELLLEKTRRLLPSIEEREPQYRKTPAAWLNGGHWEDEPQQEFRQRIQTAEELDAWRPS